MWLITGILRTRNVVAINASTKPAATGRERDRKRQRQCEQLGDHYGKVHVGTLLVQSGPGRRQTGVPLHLWW